MEENSRGRKAITQVRATMHIGMGILYLVIGTMVLYVKHFGMVELSAMMAYPLGILMLAYGVFRIWRGFKDLRTNK